MRPNRSIPEAVVIPELAYPDVAEAAAWLCAAFGFEERLRIADHRLQLSFPHGGAIVVTQVRPGGDASPTDSLHSVLVRVDDVAEHHARCVRHGARILRPPTEYPYGEKQYSVEDLGGHVWTFSETIADVDPASWGGTLRHPGNAGRFER